MKVSLIAACSAALRYVAIIAGVVSAVCALVFSNTVPVEAFAVPRNVRIAAVQHGDQLPRGSTVVLDNWKKYILAESRSRYCDKEMGEEIGWLVSPFVNGFYYGYLADHDPVWAAMLVDWTDSWIKRGIREPDGYLGWPKPDGASTEAVPSTTTDNIVGDAMALRPAVLMSGVILKTPGLDHKYGAKARSYIALSESMFNKWDTRGCWRLVKDGGVWVVPPFGLDSAGTRFTAGYSSRTSGGFTLPANKQNLVAQWLLAMFDVTGKPVYRDRAALWFNVMKLRMRTRDAGRYFVWDYWNPAGPWDYKPDGSTVHWVGVHPNGGYYGIDVEAIVAAYEHGLVFTRGDIDRLIATNRDFMWNQRVQPAVFKRIDGEAPDARWKDSAGVLWLPLARYDSKLRPVADANLNPASWGGLSVTPWYVVRIRGDKL